MSFDILKFLDDYNIQYFTEGKNISKEWIGLKCPFCDSRGDPDPSAHLGANIVFGKLHCWRCGSHSLPQTIQKLTGCSKSKAYEILEKYGETKSKQRYKKPEKEKNITVELPKGTLDYFPEQHKKYLENRNFNANKLIRDWDLYATGRGGAFKNRIIIPIYQNGKLMSYQGRDITGKSKIKYKAAVSENERRNLKDCLYGIDSVPGKRAIVTEGVTDVWRLGYGAVATFGISYTRNQVSLLAYYFNIIFVLYDEESQAQENAINLAHELNMLGANTENITLDTNCDPGDLKQDDADYLLRELLIK